MEVVPVKKCTGCAACLFRCPRSAIRMAEDEEGFLYPRVDSEKCNSCGLCRAICPVKNNRSGRPETSPVLYAGWTKDQSLLKSSTSGGIFSELARPVLQEGGVVFGAAYDDRMVVRHKAVEVWEDLRSLRGSKYVQSDVGDTYHQTEEHLKAGRRVLYSGTPCQIAGLRKALSKVYQNLTTCDLICHGVASPKVFRNAIKSYEVQYNAKVVEFLFRDKRYGWLHPSIVIGFSNGKKIIESNVDNAYNIGFLKNLYLRPVCYECTIKKVGPFADVTIGDFWELMKFNPSLVNPIGTSAIIANTTAGKYILDSIDCMIVRRECPFNVIEAESNLFKSVKMNSDRQQFFSEIDNLSYSQLSKNYMKTRSKFMKIFSYGVRILRKNLYKLSQRYFGGI